LRKAFDEIDSDRNEEISYSELEQWIRAKKAKESASAAGKPSAEAGKNEYLEFIADIIEEIYAGFDGNKDGRI